MDAAISLQGITKYYGRHRQLGCKDVSFEIFPGELFGYLGPNGAGKTTTIRCLLDVIHPTSGEATILGMNCQEQGLEIRKQVGYVPGEFGLPEGISGKRVLDYYAMVQDRQPILRDYLLDAFEIPPKMLRKKVKNYSKGMKQHIGLIQALQGDPEVLIMDEGSAGLDPLKQNQFYKVLKSDIVKERAILYSSHNLAEVEKICDRVGIIRKGKIVEVAKVSELKIATTKAVHITSSDAIPIEDLQQINGVTYVHQNPFNDQYIVEISGSVDSLIKFLSNFAIEDLDIVQQSLEEIFLNYYQDNKRGK